MSKVFNVYISTPNKVCLNQEVVSITMPTANGYIGILPEHARICGAVMPGYMYITLPSGEKKIALINYGMYYFKENKLVILSDFFEYNTGVNESALETIRLRIEEECKKVQLSDRAVHALNSYMKLVSAKAKQKK
ncbi:MAG: ATP synthase F1 subunit epsilon [Mycoplasmoidaceae bacterium]|nr:ATP synthase F1 subunit epsilon [Mycoplasmoidaceae bacterium]